MKDLVVLVADKNMEFAMRGILDRPKALGARPIDYKLIPHPQHDARVRTSGPEFLRGHNHQYWHGIIMLDWEGSGVDQDESIELENELDARLGLLWGDRGKAIVIEPELDVWVWGSEKLMRQVLEWEQNIEIREWLAGQGHEFDRNGKPSRPKEALEDLMYKLGEPRSSMFYQKLTARQSLTKCVDPAFGRLRTTLRSWFPA